MLFNFYLFIILSSSALIHISLFLAKWCMLPSGNIEPLTVVPNPATEKITINGLSAYENSSIAVMNIEGKVIAQKEHNNSGNADFDLTSLNKGVYFVKVAHMNGIETIKFIKQ